MSSGATGWALADHLYRHGHDVTCVAGLTTSPSPDWLPLIIRTPTPGEMLKECKALSNDGIDAWIHAAAVLDYVVDSPAEGKIASQQGSLSLDLVESPKTHSGTQRRLRRQWYALDSNLNPELNKKI